MITFQWVVNHLQEIIILAAVVAAAFGRVMKFSGRMEKTDEVQGKGTVRGESAEIPESARKIQEEIRRKIAERSAGRQSAAPPVLASGPLRSEPPSVDRAPAQTLATRLREKLERQMAEVRVRQDTMAQDRRAKLEIEARAEVAEQKAAAVERAATLHPVAAQFPTERRITVGGSLVAGLREPGSLRRAIILREVIGPPLSLR